MERGSLHTPPLQITAWLLQGGVIKQFSLQVSMATGVICLFLRWYHLGQFTSHLAREGLRTEPLQHETGLRVRRWVWLWPQSSRGFLHLAPLGLQDLRRETCVLCRV